MRALFVLGRAIFGGFFAYNGINYFLQQRNHAESKRAPAADAAIQAGGVMLLAGGLSVILGAKPRQGLAAIVAFLVPVTLQMHRFWEEEDPAKRMAELVNFSKNMALVGAALALMEIDEPWPVSVDEARADREEMFVRLGGRDLRALPA
jgi:putative oxidoreductase